MRIVQTLQVGSLILVLPDGRKFIAYGQSGITPINKQTLHAELHIHNPEFFSRLVREGDLGFADSYLDGLVVHSRLAGVDGFVSCRK